MARRHPNPLDDPPAVSSSGEEEEVEEEEVEEEEFEEEEFEEEEFDEEEEEVVPNANHNVTGSEEEVDDGEEEEEEEEEEDGNEDEDDDKEELKTEKIHPQPSQSKPVPKKTNPEEDEEDEDDETESDSDPRSPGVSGFTIRKHAAIDSPNSKASAKPKRDKESVSPVLVSLKRHAEADLQRKDSKSSAKKAKVENGRVEEAGTEKKSGILRLWNEESEISILKGMIDFLDTRGVDPNSDSTAFHEFIKDRLSVEVTKNQLMDKVRRLKKKYRNNVGKGQKGEDPVFSRPHEHKSFHLSKKIWGGDDIQKKSSSKKKNPVSEKAKPDTQTGKDNGSAKFAKSLPKVESLAPLSYKKEQGNVQEGDFSQLYPFLNHSLKKNNFSADLISKDGADAVMSCLRCLEKSKLDELEEEWRNQILAEADMCARRSVLLQKQVQLVLDWNARRG